MDIHHGYSGDRSLNLQRRKAPGDEASKGEPGWGFFSWRSDGRIPHGDNHGIKNDNQIIFFPMRLVFGDSKKEIW